MKDLFTRFFGIRRPRRTAPYAAAALAALGSYAPLVGGEDHQYQASMPEKTRTVLAYENPNSQLYPAGLFTTPDERPSGLFVGRYKKLPLPASRHQKATRSATQAPDLTISFVFQDPFTFSWTHHYARVASYSPDERLTAQVRLYDENGDLLEESNKLLILDTDQSVAEIYVIYAARFPDEASEAELIVGYETSPLSAGIRLPYKDGDRGSPASASDASFMAIDGAAYGTTGQFLGTSSIVSDPDHDAAVMRVEVDSPPQIGYAVNLPTIGRESTQAMINWSNLTKNPSSRVRLSPVDGSGQLPQSSDWGSVAVYPISEVNRTAPLGVAEVTHDGTGFTIRCPLAALPYDAQVVQSTPLVQTRLIAGFPAPLYDRVAGLGANPDVTSPDITFAPDLINSTIPSTIAFDNNDAVWTGWPGDAYTCYAAKKK